MDFAALQQRLGQVRKPSRHWSGIGPGNNIAFDVLAAAKHDARDLPLSQRRALLKELARRWGRRCPSPPPRPTPEVAAECFAELPLTGIEGLIINSLLNEHLDTVQEGACGARMVCFLVPAVRHVESKRLSVLGGWDAPDEDEERAGLHAGTPILLSPDFVGLRRFSSDGVPGAAWGGRMEDRNSAFPDVLFSSGVRLIEAASLLTLRSRSPRQDTDGTTWDRLAATVTKSKRARMFYLAAPVVGPVPRPLGGGGTSTCQTAPAGPALCPKPAIS